MEGISWNLHLSELIFSFLFGFFPLKPPLSCLEASCYCRGGSSRLGVLSGPSPLVDMLQTIGGGFGT
jgi:hypothetical protein